MIRKFNGSLGYVIHLFTDWSNLTESLQKVHTFYVSNEVQKGIVNKIEENNEVQRDSSKLGKEIALRIKGNFSWGWDKQEKKEEEKKDETNKENKDKEANSKKNDDAEGL